MSGLGKVTCLIGAAVALTSVTFACVSSSATYFVPALLGLLGCWSGAQAVDRSRS